MSGYQSVIQTKRLALRRFREDDAEFVLGLLNEPSFLSNIGDKGVRTLEDAREYVRTGPVESYARHGFGLYLILQARKGQPVSEQSDQEPPA